MSIAAEIQQAARAIREQTPPTATFHRAVGVLLDHLALSAPHYATELHLAPATRLALAVARSFQDPSGTGPPLVETAVLSHSAAVAPAEAVVGSAASAPARPLPDTDLSEVEATH